MVAQPQRLQSSIKTLNPNKMIYGTNILIPKNTPASKPIRAPIQVVNGLVYKIEIAFPPGPEGTAHIVINDGGFQVWPSSPGVDFAADEYTISFDDTYLKTTDPLEFQVYGYNTDEINPHTIQVRIGMVANDIFMARFLPTMTYDFMMRKLKEMEEAERVKAAKILKEPFDWIASR